MGRASKQNPGFGAAGHAHQLPHEASVEANSDAPGPGKYAMAASPNRVDGHGSSFAPPSGEKSASLISPSPAGILGRKGSAKGSKKAVRV